MGGGGQVEGAEEEDGERNLSFALFGNLKGGGETRPYRGGPSAFLRSQTPKLVSARNTPMDTPRSSAHSGCPVEVTLT